MKVGGYDLYPVQTGGEIKGGTPNAGGSGQTKLLYTQAGSALSTVVNTASLTAFTTPFTPPTVPAGVLNSIGALLTIEAGGVFQTTATPTLLFTCKFDDVSTGEFIGNALFTAPTNGGPAGWYCTFGTITKTLGSSGTVCDLAGIGTLGIFSGSAGIVNNGIPFTGVTVDLTVSHTIQLGITWGAMSSSNSISLQTFTVKIAYPVTAGTMV